MAKSEPLIDKNRKEIEKKPKVVCLAEYFNFRSFKKEFITNTMLDRLAQELIAYVEGNEEVLKIKDFLAFKGIPEKVWGDWIVKYEILREAHNHAKMILGNRRERGILTRKLVEGSTAFMMPMYDEDWGVMLKRKADLANKVDETGGRQVVVMTVIPNDPSVPSLKKDED